MVVFFSHFLFLAFFRHVVGFKKVGGIFNVFSWISAFCRYFLDFVSGCLSLSCFFASSVDLYRSFLSFLTFLAFSAAGKNSCKVFFIVQYDVLILGSSHFMATLRSPAKS